MATATAAWMYSFAVCWHDGVRIGGKRKAVQANSRFVALATALGHLRHGWSDLG